MIFLLLMLDVALKADLTRFAVEQPLHVNVHILRQMDFENQVSGPGTEKSTEILATDGVRGLDARFLSRFQRPVIHLG